MSTKGRPSEEAPFDMPPMVDRTGLGTNDNGLSHGTASPNRPGKPGFGLAEAPALQIAWDVADNRAPEPFPTLTVTVGAILASLGMFIGVAYVVLQDPNNERVADNPVGLYVGAMGAIPWLLGIILRRRFLAGQGERLRKEGGERSDWVSAYVTSHILGAALCEATTVFGFTATFLSGDMSWVLLYAGLSAFGILVGFPTPGRYRQWLRDWGGPDGSGFA